MKKPKKLPAIKAIEEDAAKIVAIIEARLQERGIMLSNYIDDLFELARIKFRNRF